MSIELIKKKGFEVQVIRTNRRKTTSIQISYGIVTIRVPKQLVMDEIELLIDSRQSWIKQKLDQQQHLLPPQKKEYITGEKIYYLGKNYSLKIDVAAKQTVELSGAYILVRVKKNEPEVVRKTLKKWYLEQAKKQVMERVGYYSTLMNVLPNTIQVREYKARWGSCNIKGDVKFNWKLIMSSIEVIDYVVVHELCHLTEHNHSAKFWKLVKSILPNYKVQRLWLREKGYQLEL